MVPLTVDLGRRVRRYLARALVGAILVTAGLALVRAPTVAHANRTMLDVGAGLLVYAGATAQDGPRTLLLNGAELALSAGVTGDRLDAVLDAQERACDTRRAGDEAPPTTVRTRDGRRGFALCTLGALDFADPESLARTLEQLATEGALSTGGALRFVYAEERNGRTHFVSFHSPGLDLDALFPASGDAPGSAAPVRPPGGRRILSLAERGHDYHMTVFAGSPAPVTAVNDHYARSLGAAGFRVLSRRGDAEGLSARASLLAGRGDQLVLAVSFADGDTTTSAILTAGRAAMAQLAADGRSLP